MKYSEEAHRIETRCPLWKQFIKLKSYTGVHQSVADKLKTFPFATGIITHQQIIPGRKTKLRECKNERWFLHRDNESILDEAVFLSWRRHRKDDVSSISLHKCGLKAARAFESRGQWRLTRVVTDLCQA